MITKCYKVYGREGHRQGASFLTSCDFDIISEKGERIFFWIQNADLTGTHDYSVVSVTAESAEDCRSYLESQISDGFFENYNVGYVEEF